MIRVGYVAENAPLCCIGADLSTKFTTELGKPERTTTGERTGSVPIAPHRRGSSHVTLSDLQQRKRTKNQRIIRAYSVTCSRKGFVLKREKRRGGGGRGGREGEKKVSFLGLPNLPDRKHLHLLKRPLCLCCAIGLQCCRLLQARSNAQWSTPSAHAAED